MSHHRHLDSIYRNYDIRGKYPEEITDEEVKKIGAAIVKRFLAKKIAVGRDIRPSSLPLFKALVAGITSEGCTVIDLGLVTTPMTYFVCGSTDVDATVMITASHMPSEYNGLKISVDDARPVTKDVLDEIKAIVGEHTFSEESIVGDIIESSPVKEWHELFKQQHQLKGRPLRIVIDPANMIGAIEIETFKALAPAVEVVSIFDEFDHTCPNHEANPLKTETLTALGMAVQEHKADLGIAFDGDADRVGFVDEKGGVVSADIIGALLARIMLEKYPGSTILYDLRSSRAVREEIERCGGVPIEWKVGHTNIRTKMRECDAVLGIELAGHYFFKDTYYSEGGPYPALLIMELVQHTACPLSSLVAQVRRYHHSGEINRTVSASPQVIYEKLASQYPNATASELDGLKLVCDSWWCNVRPSANDPVIRLNIEADTIEEMQLRRGEILTLLDSFGTTAADESRDH